ncbi:MAG: response regulator [Sedimentisphaerales bacterium]|nr:response regulator [Sedimentisphaerales bacterium]
MRNSRPILLLEDDNVDAMTIQRAMNEIKVSNPLVHVANGEDGLIYLHKSDNEKPCLIMLDLNMPKMNGLEFLKIIKSNAEFRQIPVIVLTTSQQEQDKLESFKLSVAGYIVKPTDYKKFVEAVKTLDLYWTLSESPVNMN